MTPPKLIIHLHIPKNAGTSLGRMMRAKIALWPPSHYLRHSLALGFYHLPHVERIARLSALSPRDQRRVRMLDMHGGFGVHERLPMPASYLTMLREPIERSLSSYSFQKQEGHIDPEMTLETWACADHPHRVWYSDNAQLRYLAGVQGEIVDVPNGECTREMLELAKTRIDHEFLLIGFAEEFDATVVLLRQRLGWHGCLYGKSNVTRDRLRQDDLPGETLALLRERNALDIELYDYARARFDAEIQAQGAAFDAEVAAFRRRMARSGPMLAKLYGFAGVGRNFRRRIQRRLVRGKGG